MWTTENTAEELESARQCPVIRSQPVARESGGPKEEIAHVRARVLGHSTSPGSKEKRKPSYTVE